ncbi:hypothetical protein M885DRAFT_453401, partial [Pelagophyceae sp. CCMP2097]
PCLQAPRPAAAAAAKVLVLGGDGFVGSRVCAALAAQGCAVVAASRTLDAALPAGVAFAPLDLTAPGAADEVARLSAGCVAVVSCVGAIGTPLDLQVNGATGLVAVAAKKAGVSKFVYVSVAPDVHAALGSVGALQPYFEGKASSEAAISAAFGADATFLRPTFIYGGDAFNVNPPRVASAYGAFVEAALSTPLLRFAAGVSPGLISVALEPPVSVDAVAAAAAAAALGKGAGGFDDHDAIVALAAML